nr:hypothetical protein CFP56_11833 [Quercus suber]
MFRSHLLKRKQVTDLCNSSSSLENCKRAVHFASCFTSSTLFQTYAGGERVRTSPRLQRVHKGRRCETTWQRHEELLESACRLLGVNRYRLNPRDNSGIQNKGQGDAVSGRVKKGTECSLCIGGDEGEIAEKDAVAGILHCPNRLNAGVLVNGTNKNK